jgi:hypothetical protein
MGFLTGYSLAAILGGSCIGIVGTLLLLAPVLRRHPPAPTSSPVPAPTLTGFDEPSRPARCDRCGADDLVHVPRLAVQSEPLPEVAGPLALRPAPSPVELELLVCPRCGRAEWFAASPRALEPFRARAKLPARAPYRS